MLFGLPPELIFSGVYGSLEGENGMTEPELKFPEWQEPLREAILERDPKQLAEKTQEVETLIRERLQQLRMNDEARNANRSVEEQALVDALSVIRIVLRDRV
jgi:hypothetical protein